MRTGDYTNTNFYRLVCRDITITDEYIGHTTKFRERKCQHKRICCTKDIKGYNAMVYQFIRENGGWDNWDMVLIEIKSFNNVLEARAYERDLIETRKATLNTNIPNRTEKEWSEANREKILEQKKARYEANKAEIKAHNDAHREQKKAYRDARKAEIKAYNKAYYEAKKAEKLI